VVCRLVRLFSKSQGPGHSAGGAWVTLSAFASSLNNNCIAVCRPPPVCSVVFRTNKVRSALYLVGGIIAITLLHRSLSSGTTLVTGE
jgi:hypothetical protein